jgi:hypothetical protein
MLAKLKADLVAAKAYVVVHYKQLVAALVAGKYSGAVISAVVALYHAL